MVLQLQYVRQKKALQRIVRGTERVIGISLPSDQELVQERPNKQNNQQLPSTSCHIAELADLEYVYYCTL